MFFIALVRFGTAAEQITSPDGRWTIRTTTGETNPAVAIFNTDGRPVAIIDRDTTGSKRVAAKWSSDSNKVVLLDQAPLGSGIIAAWFDGTNWHAAAEPDNDLRQAEALAKSQGLRGDVKAEQRELGDWISPDIVQIRGTLRYLGGKEFPYSYNLQIVPGYYSLNHGGLETGGLKAFHFHAGS